MVFTPEMITKSVPNYGTDPTAIDGVACSFAADAWKREDLNLPESLSIQQVHVSWSGFFAGDFGILRIVNPIVEAGYISPSSAVSVDDTTVDVGDAGIAAAIAAGYSLEFWADDDSALVEARRVVSATGSVVTLAEAVTHAHSTSARLRSVVSDFAPVGGGGVDRLNSGFRAVGNGQLVFGSEGEATDPIPAGLILAHRFKATSDAGTRSVAVSYRFRRPGE